MLKADVTFERVLGTFIPGSIFCFGTWYLHRPFLLRHFPHIAGDPSVSSFGGLATEIKFLLFIFAALCVGLIVNQCHDIAVAVVFQDENDSGAPDAAAPHAAPAGAEDRDGGAPAGVKVGRPAAWSKTRVLRLAARFIALTPHKDPRARIMAEYLASPRREAFLRMVADWASTDAQRVESRREKLLVHQHAVVRLKVLSESSRKLVEETFFPVVFSASVLVAFVLLLPVAGFAFLTSRLVIEDIPVHFDQTIIVSIGIIYAGAFVTGLVMKRQFKTFCEQVLTLALHFHGMVADRRVRGRADNGERVAVRDALAVGLLTGDDD